VQQVDAAAETGVTVAAPSHAAPGNAFTVTVTVEPEEPLGGMECDIRFNASVLEVQQVEAGELFEEWWNSSLTIDNDNGTVSRLLGFNYQGNETTTPGTFATVTFTATGEGSGWIRLANVTLSDPTGNQTAPYDATNDTVIIIDDATPPALNYTLSPTAPDGKNGWYVGTVEISVTAQDDHGVQSLGYHVGSQDWQTAAGDSATFTVSQDGNHTVYLRATDVVGNTNTTSFPLKVDTEPPTSSCSVPGNIWRNDPEVTVDWQASDAGGLWGVSLWYRPASGTEGWQTASFAAANGSADSGSMSIDMAGLGGEGLYQLATSASDRAGNDEGTPTAADCECGYDGSPPTANVTLTGTEIEPDVYENSVTIQVTGNDGLSGVDSVEYTMDGSDWTVLCGPFPDRGSYEGLPVRADGCIGSPAASKAHYYGISLLEPSVLGVAADAGGGAMFGPLLAACLEAGLRVCAHLDPAVWMDMGSLKLLRKNILAGGTWVSPGADVASGARITGTVSIGDGCRVGPGAAVRDSVMLAGSSIRSGRLEKGMLPWNTTFESGGAIHKA